MVMVVMHLYSTTESYVCIDGDGSIEVIVIDLTLLNRLTLPVILVSIPPFFILLESLPLHQPTINDNPYLSFICSIT
jgi:hypothetical protein